MLPVNPERVLPLGLAALRGPMTIARLAAIRIKYRGVLRHGSNFRIGAGAVFASPGPIVFGDRVRVARGLHVETTLAVGDDVLISSDVAIIGNDHPFDNSTRRITEFERAGIANVRIGSDCLVGFRATIIGSVSVGQGAIIGAGSVVTKDVPPNAIVAGVPARILRSRRGQGSAERFPLT